MTTDKARFDATVNQALALQPVCAPYFARLCELLADLVTALEREGLPKSECGAALLGLVVALVSKDLGMDPDEIAQTLTQILSAFGELHARAIAIAIAQSS